MVDHISVPLERVGVIIGSKGGVKELIEEKSTATLEIDSNTGSIHITSAKDPIKAMRVIEVIQAIGRGFSPEKALQLFDEELLTLTVVDLSNIANTQKSLKRIKGRIIGKNGKTREIIESLTNTKISVYGKTVSIIGYPVQVQIVRTAIQMLVDGAPHNSVYKYLEKKRQETKIIQSEYNL